MRNYSDLEVWKKCRELVTVIYKYSSKFPQSEMFGLSSQMRRSAVLIPSNIAEGCGRNSSADTLKFLFIARGSLYELENTTLSGF
ncbi:MAG TPA: four helix bundle protein [Flavipsychrobacter sp.]|nr:four helix bundle protein [Flavipsychrobacter sp.]